MVQHAVSTKLLFRDGSGLRMRVLALQVVLSKPTPDARVEDGEFEENEAWALDIVLSTGEGKPKARTACHPVTASVDVCFALLS